MNIRLETDLLNKNLWIKKDGLNKGLMAKWKSRAVFLLSGSCYFNETVRAVL